MSECKHNWVFFYPVCICSECDVKRDTDTLFAQQKARIKALERMVLVARQLLTHLQLGSDESYWYCWCCSVTANKMPLPHEDNCTAGELIAVLHKLKEV